MHSHRLKSIEVVDQFRLTSYSLVFLCLCFVHLLSFSSFTKRAPAVALPTRSGLSGNEIGTASAHQSLDSSSAITQHSFMSWQWCPALE